MALHNYPRCYQRVARVNGLIEWNASYSGYIFVMKLCSFSCLPESAGSRSYVCVASLGDYLFLYSLLLSCMLLMFMFLYFFIFLSGNIPSSLRCPSPLIFLLILSWLRYVCPLPSLWVAKLLNVALAYCLQSWININTLLCVSPTWSHY